MVATQTGRKAIFVDVDGTIYDHEIIDQTAVAAIRQVRAAGNLVFLCTGRSAGMIPQAIYDIGFDGAITNGGCDIFIHGELLVSQAMPRADVSE
ncbi:MAG: HAD hydrolase family protein, partial [Promicromonosporaceae bacterium]|nr:HAD hydrolase family protein [Promicromonosporaceae bacterium]